MCIADGSGNFKPEKDHPAEQPYQCFVYPVTNLRKPAFTTGMSHFAVALDCQHDAATSTTGGADVNLIKHNMKGLVVKEQGVGDASRATAPA